MTIVPPNFVSVRLLDADKDNYAKVHEAAERAAGKRLATADVYRLAVLALAEKYKVGGMQ
jgi:hypothetical protein